jgi:ketose-bisphosphate aldolase
MGVLDIVPAGVLTGDNVRKLFDYAKEHKFAIPAINVTSTSTANAALEAARDIKSPIILQVSQGGSAYFAGKGLANDKQQASIIGAITAAQHVRLVSRAYGVPVVMHSDHCAEKLLPWFDGMLEADEAYFKQHQEPLFSSHMLDLSEDPKEKNIEICAKYFKRMAPIGLWLEMEIGITGGEEDGVDNTGADNASLYTQPEDVYDVYTTLSKIGYILLVSRQGKLRLAKWFTTMAPKAKAKIVKDVTQLVLARRTRMCNFLEYKDTKVVYRRYASLFFVCGIGSGDNELITLEIIHRYVEVLDRYFGNVCELDLIFNFQKAYAILDELIIAGEMQESSKKSVLRVVTQSDTVEEQEGSDDIMGRLAARSGPLIR